MKAREYGGPLAVLAAGVIGFSLLCSVSAMAMSDLENYSPATLVPLDLLDVAISNLNTAAALTEQSVTEFVPTATLVPTRTATLAPLPSDTPTTRPTFTQPPPTRTRRPRPSATPPPPTRTRIPPSNTPNPTATSTRPPTETPVPSPTETSPPPPTTPVPPPTFTDEPTAEPATTEPTQPAATQGSEISLPDAQTSEP